MVGRMFSDVNSQFCPHSSKQPWTMHNKGVGCVPIKYLQKQVVGGIWPMADCRDRLQGRKGNRLLSHVLHHQVFHMYLPTLITYTFL